MLLLQHSHLDGRGSDTGADLRESALAQGSTVQREAAAMGDEEETEAGAAGQGLCEEARGGATGAPGAEQDDA